MLAQEIHRRDAERAEGALSKFNFLRQYQRLLCVSAVSLFLLLLTVACKTTGGGAGAGGTVNTGNGGAAGEKSFTPPFQTREPERYQARMVLTSASETKQESQNRSETFIVRDGAARREDYEWRPGLKVSDLNLHAGHFLLLHDRKLYAEVSSSEALASAAHSGSDISLPEDFSPDRLVNESRTGAVYERLGVEEWNGRSTVKYRVSTTKADGASAAPVEQLIWIDEQLGMPVRSETIAKSGGANNVTYSMEILDLKQEVDPALFTVPQDYRKVSMKEMLAQLSARQEDRED